MTLELLLGMSADSWDKLSLIELAEWASKHFTVTKPSCVPAADKAGNKNTSGRVKANQAIEEARKIAQQLNIKINF